MTGLTVVMLDVLLHKYRRVPCLPLAASGRYVEVRLVGTEKLWSYVVAHTPAHYFLLFLFFPYI